MDIEDGVASKAVLRDLRNLYMHKVLPIEELTSFSRCGHGIMHQGDFESPPIVLIMGPYSAGKTTFIEHLIGKKFPGQRIGPEPTTDKFVAIMKGEDERVIPGNALTVTPNTPFNGLEKFGNNFLMRFEGSQVNDAPILDHLTIVDTPGVLSGEKQKSGRSYSYAKVLDWFAERSDMIILLFDVQKLDICDEMADSIKTLQKHYDKIRVVLNKADSISHQNLLKVYGALLWSLGRVITTPEVTKVYIGSFWEKPLANEDTKTLMETEMADLLADLAALPRLGAVRKINDMVKRIRQVRVHAILLNHLRLGVQSMFGKDKKRRDMLANLGSVFRDVQGEYNLPYGDFPDLEMFKKTVETMDFKKMPRIKGEKMKKGGRMLDLERSLSVAIPDLLTRLPGINTVQYE